MKQVVIRLETDDGEIVLTPGENGRNSIAFLKSGEIVELSLDLWEFNSLLAILTATFST